MSADEVEGGQPVPFLAECDLHDGVNRAHDSPARKVTRLPTSERQFQEAVIHLLQFSGYLVYHTYDSRRSEPGFPDIVAVHPKRGDLFIAELKGSGGKPTRAQLDWIDAFQAAGVDADVYWPEDTEIIFERIRDPRWDKFKEGR